MRGIQVRNITAFGDARLENLHAASLQGWTAENLVQHGGSPLGESDKGVIYTFPVFRWVVGRSRCVVLQ